MCACFLYKNGNLPIAFRLCERGLGIIRQMDRNGPSMAYGLKHVIIGYHSYISGRDMIKKTTDFATILPYFTLVVYMKLFACDNFTILGYFPLHFKKALVMSS